MTLVKSESISTPISESWEELELERGTASRRSTRCPLAFEPSKRTRTRKGDQFQVLYLLTVSIEVLIVELRFVKFRLISGVYQSNLKSAESRSVLSLFSTDSDCEIISGCNRNGHDGTSRPRGDASRHVRGDASRHVRCQDCHWNRSLPFKLRATGTFDLGTVRRVSKSNRSCYDEEQTECE